MTAVRVFIVDDHEVVRDGLRALLRDEPDIEVVGEAATAGEARATIPTLRPDVTLLDLNLPDGNGIEVCRDLAGDPDVRFLVLSSVAEDEALLAAILAGAAGYVLKHVRGGELVDDIRRVARGEPLLDQRTRGHVLERLRRSTTRPGSTVPELSGQEQQVFDLLADGLTNRAIADHLGLAEKTVKNYVSNVLTKLGMARRTEVAVYAAALAERAKRPPRSDSGTAIRY